MLTNVNFTAETLSVLTVAQAKKQLNIEDGFNDHNDLIQSYIDAGVESCENYIGGYIIPGALVLSYSKFEKEFIFEAFPLKSITSVKYYKDGSQLTLSAINYALTKTNNKTFCLRIKSDLPQTDERHDAVEITVSVGFEGNKIPKTIVQAIKLQVANMYEVREDRKEVVSTSAMNLLRPYKKF